MDPRIQELLDKLLRLLSKRDLWIFVLFLVVPVISGIVRAIKEARKRQEEVKRMQQMPRAAAEAPPAPPRPRVEPRPPVPRVEPPPRREPVMNVPPRERPVAVEPQRTLAAAGKSYSSFDPAPPPITATAQPAMMIGELSSEGAEPAALDAYALPATTADGDPLMAAFYGSRLQHYNSDDWRASILISEILRPPLALRPPPMAIGEYH
jgi:hypothetical protein